MDKDEIKAAIKESFKEEIAPFYVDRETHYQDHLFLKGMRDFQGSLKNVAAKTVVGIVITAIGTLMLYGFVFWMKKKF